MMIDGFFNSKKLFWGKGKGNGKDKGKGKGKG